MVMVSWKKRMSFSQVIVVIILIYMPAIYSNTVTAKDIVTETSRWGINLYLGEAQNTTSNTSGLKFSTYETDTLTNPNKSSTDIAPGLGITYRHVISPNNNSLIHALSASLNYYYTDMSRDGQVYLFGYAQFNNYTYKMKINSNRLMLDGELELHPLVHNITLFGILGIGGALNTMSYKEKSVFTNVGGQLDFSSHDQLNFASEIGGGVKMPVNKNSVISLRYLYTDLGEATSKNQSSTPARRLENPLSTDIVSQSILLGYTYYFN